MIVHRRAGCLDQKHIAATNVLADLDLDVLVAERDELDGACRDSQGLADALRQRLVAVGGKNLEPHVTHEKSPFALQHHAELFPGPLGDRRQRMLLRNSLQ